MRAKQGNMLDIGTLQENTWCPGCLNFATLEMLKRAILELNEEKEIDINKTVLVTDIGCGGKIYDYININAIYALHGRVIPVAAGIRAGRPDLTVIGFAGDGGTYDEGMNHLVHAANRNVNMAMIVGNNRVFALTKGQPTSTNPSLSGMPLNPLLITADSGASFVARASAYNPKELKEILKEAIIHEGFSLTEIIQPCLIFKNDAEEIKNNTYSLLKSDTNKSLEILRADKKGIPTGVFVRKKRNLWESGSIAKRDSKS